jgi:Domain of unknown function (DUF4430)
MNLRPMNRRPPALFAAAALALAGCGLAGGSASSSVSVSVTRDFGSAAIGSTVQRHLPGGETAMGLLQRSFTVSTGHRKSVESIDGHSAGPGRYGWSLYVNGILAPKRPAATAVNAGDRLWWDLHDRSAAHQIPAVVGSYPEPFANGIGGRRFPTVLDCADNVTRACNVVGASLHKAGVKVSYQVLGAGSGSDSLAVVVGTWRDLRGVIAADLIGSGPATSGVFAQFVGAGGQALELDNAQGSVVRTLRAGGGLIAATEQPSLNQPTWLVTGTDVAGVNDAAAALTPARLHNHFALAVDGSRDLPLPLPPAG